MVRAVLPLSASALALAFATVLPTCPALALQLDRDAVGALGGSASHATLRLRDTAGLPVIGREVFPEGVLWKGFWFPRPSVVSGVPEEPPVIPDGDGLTLPTATRFLGVFPNPAGPTSTIRFEIAGPPLASSATTPVPARIELYDVNGRLAARIFDGVLVPGAHSLSWNAASGGARTSNGVYFLRFRSGDYQVTRRVVVVRARP